MSIPVNRQQFAEYCLRRLGRPAIKINVSEQQIDDRIDEAISYWQDFEVDGTSRQLYKYQITATDIGNGYIQLPANIIGAVSIFSPGDAINAANIFNIRYQIALNDLYTLTSVSLAPYYMAFQQIRLIEMLLIGEKPVRYNQITNILYLDMDMSIWQPGNFIIVDCYQVIDPNTYTAMWGNRMLQRYATALIKKQWGENLSKFPNIQLLGGTTFNGQQIKNEAMQEMKEVQEEIRSSYEMPPDIFYG